MGCGDSKQDEKPVVAGGADDGGSSPDGTPWYIAVTPGGEVRFWFGHHTEQAASKCRLKLKAKLHCSASHCDQQTTVATLHVVPTVLIHAAYAMS